MLVRLAQGLYMSRVLCYVITFILAHAGSVRLFPQQYLRYYSQYRKTLIPENNIQSNRLKDTKAIPNLHLNLKMDTKGWLSPFLSVYIRLPIKKGTFLIQTTYVSPNNVL